MAKLRSRRYPAIATDEAIPKAARIFSALGTESVDRHSLANILGSTNGAGGKSAQTISALVQYGFLERKAGAYSATRLAEMAVTAEVSGDTSSLSRRVFLNPPLFRELVERFRSEHKIPQNLSEILTSEHGITAKASPVATENFLRSAKLSGWLDKNGVFISRNGHTSNGGIEESSSSPSETVSSSQVRHPRPSVHHLQGSLVPPEPFTKAKIDWTQYLCLKSRILDGGLDKLSSSLGLCVTAALGMLGIGAKFKDSLFHGAIMIGLASIAVSTLFWSIKFWFSSQRNKSDDVLADIFKNLEREFALPGSAETNGGGRLFSTPYSVDGYSSPEVLETGADFPPRRLPVLEIRSPTGSESVLAPHKPLCQAVIDEVERQVGCLSVSTCRISGTQGVNGHPAELALVGTIGPLGRAYRYQMSLVLLEGEAHLWEFPMMIDPANSKTPDFEEPVAGLKAAIEDFTRQNR